jgi:membrane-associated phospholipid phosphatase
LLLVGAAVGALLANNAALDTFMWRGTRWFMGSQDSYVWTAYRVDPAVHPDAPWYQTLEPPMHGRIYKRTEQLWRLFRDLGEPWTTILLLVIFAVYERRRLRALAVILAATLSTGALSALIRIIAGRLRPTGAFPDGARNEGANHWVFCRGFWQTSDLSFPSGHATLAFATAAALAYLSPRGRWLFYALAVGCALARVVMQAHFYSDVLVGALLGAFFGHLSARWVGSALETPPAAPQAADPTPIADRHS